MHSMYYVGCMFASVYCCKLSMLSCRWTCLISYNTNQSLSVTAPVLHSFLSLSLLVPSLRVLPLMPCPSCSLLSHRVSSHLFSSLSDLFPSRSLPTALSLSFLSHSLYLPLYNWWEAGVVFSAHLLISSLLCCCLGVEVARVQRDLGVGGGGREMGRVPRKGCPEMLIMLTENKHR